MATSPSGLQAVIDGTSGATPFTVPVIIGSSHSISAPATQTVGSTTYTFSSWSDNGAATHNIVAPATATTYTATYTGGGAPPNNPPTAVASGSPTSGTAPLTVNFDGSGSSDPDAGDTISYSWDLNGDGTFGDSTAQKPSFTYTSAGTYNAVLKVTDSHNASSTSAPVTITVNPASVTTFGTTTPGTKTDSASANVKEVSKFTAPVTGNVTKVTAYISGLGSTSGTQKIRAVVYADSGGNPGALLGQSAEVTITAGRAWGWVDFTFSGGLNIPAGTVWMGFIGATKNDLTQIRYDAVTNDLKYNNNTYTSGASNPFGTPKTGSKHYSIYATYGEVGRVPRTRHAHAAHSRGLGAARVALARRRRLLRPSGRDGVLPLPATGNASVVRLVLKGSAASVGTPKLAVASRGSLPAGAYVVAGVTRGSQAGQFIATVALFNPGKGTSPTEPVASGKLVPVQLPSGFALSGAPAIAVDVVYANPTPAFKLVAGGAASVLVAPRRSCPQPESSWTRSCSRSIATCRSPTVDCSACNTSRLSFHVRRRRRSS